ncbi:lipoyl protein ligase domain-containing protein [Paenibacillus terrigena]|uniref:lipoate--protein ligase family protein n=1 Tax=Paenibacillus terrigena TaxID=369333 RepID=UPI0028D12DDA|nr:lipoate--protein ligase family protein [Paenibacillus terrigena]
MTINPLDGLRNMLLLDRTNDLNEPNVLYPFALDEILCRQTGRGGPAICHLWRHPNAFVLGLRDSRLPQVADAWAWLEDQGRSTAVRNTGGAAVPLDLGVINISLILPKTAETERHFHNDFEQMYALIREALQATGSLVEKGEIQGAFCPGDFDLSIDGRKFCGIAQRRQSHAYIVQAFVIAEGSGQARTQLTRGFYDRATAFGDPAQLDFPLVEASSTASLQELTSIGADASRVFTDAVKQVIRSLQTKEGMQMASSTLSLPSPDVVHAMAKTLSERYGIH